MENAPSNKVLSLFGDEDFVWEVEITRPVDDFLIRVPWVVGAKWRVAHQAFEEDCTERPPIALLAVSLHHEDLRSDLRPVSGRPDITNA